MILSEDHPFAHTADPAAAMARLNSNWLSTEVRRDHGLHTISARFTYLRLSDDGGHFSQGRETGTIFFRFVLPEADVEQPTARVASAAELRELGMRELSAEI
jgi:hypothetical protein